MENEKFFYVEYTHKLTENGSVIATALDSNGIYAKDEYTAVAKYQEQNPDREVRCLMDSRLNHVWECSEMRHESIEWINHMMDMINRGELNREHYLPQVMKVKEELRHIK